MTISDWDDWLVREVERTEPDGIALWYLGCNGFIYKASDGTTIFIDPYVGLGDPPRTVRMIPVPFDPADVTEADAVFGTHEHTDHVHGASQAPIVANTGATFYAPDDSLAVAREEESWTDEWDIASDQFEEVNEGDIVEIGEVTVHVEPAYDPDATHPVSYVLEHKGRTVFHGGDTKPAKEFAELGSRYEIDIGILAFGTVGQIPDKETGEPTRTKWYNDENQAIEAAADLELEAFVPTHWDMWRGLTADPKVLHHHAKSFEWPKRLELVEIGDRIER